jgi:hypothetical protein
LYFSSDDEDDTAELLAELERIKKERAEEKLRKVHFSSSVAFANIGFCLDHSSLVDCGDSYSNLIAEQPLLSLVQTRRPRDSTVCGMFTCSLDLPWQERQHQDQEMKVKESELVRGNPLLNPTSFTVKRRWDDDVIFKNQARGELKTAKRFINDTIRNDFHRKFLNKYMK